MRHLLKLVTGSTNVSKTIRNALVFEIQSLGIRLDSWMLAPRATLQLHLSIALKL